MYQLMQALSVNETDLDLNRAGRISDRQRAKLIEQRNQVILSAVGLSVLAVILSATVASVAIRDGNVAMNFIVFGLVAIVWLVYVVIYVLPRWNRINQDLAQGQVRTTEGQAHLSLITPGRHIQYQVEIDHIAFEIPEQLYRTVIEAKTYRIYYTANSKFVLSVERMAYKIADHPWRIPERQSQ